MSRHHPLRLLRESNAPVEQLREIFAPRVVFNSPIFTKPIVGRELILEILRQSVQVRDGHYTDEFRAGKKTVLVWEGTIEGHKLQSFELIEDDVDGRIVERSVAMRPYPVVSIFRDAMAKRLAGLLPKDYWAF